MSKCSETPVSINIQQTAQENERCGLSTWWWDFKGRSAFTQINLTIWKSQLGHLSRMWSVKLWWECSRQGRTVIIAYIFHGKKGTALLFCIIMILEIIVEIWQDFSAKKICDLLLPLPALSRSRFKAINSETWNYSLCTYRCWGIDFRTQIRSLCVPNFYFFCIS